MFACTPSQRGIARGEKGQVIQVGARLAERAPVRLHGMEQLKESSQHFGRHPLSRVAELDPHCQYPLVIALLHTLEPGTYVFGVAFLPDGSLLALGCNDFTVRLWQVKDK